jgi:hypothetical protein
VPTYKIADYIVPSDDEEALQAALKTSYDDGTDETRPRCLCRREEPGHERDEGIPMYISLVNDKYVVKRMPNTSETHTALCDSYELQEMTGYGAVMGTAIQEAGDGSTVLKLDFSLLDGAGRKPTASGIETEKNEVEVAASKLTLRSLLHYLWTSAELTKWIPQFAGKRTWKTVSWRINEALNNKLAKGEALKDIVYIPAPFDKNRRIEIAEERLTKFNRIRSGEVGKKRLMLLIADLQELKGTNFIARDMPDFPFLMDGKSLSDFNKVFRSEIETWESLRAIDEDKAHLIVIGTFSFSDAGNASIKKMSAMLVDENWLPFEGRYVKLLIEKLTVKGRRFEVVLGFNQKWDTPRPSIILTDAAPKPTALYVIPPNVSSDYEFERTIQAANSPYIDWSWNPTKEEPPRLPPSMKEVYIEEQKRLSQLANPPRVSNTGTQQSTSSHGVTPQQVRPAPTVQPARVAPAPYRPAAQPTSTPPRSVPSASPPVRQASVAPAPQLVRTVVPPPQPDRTPIAADPARPPTASPSVFEPVSLSTPVPPAPVPVAVSPDPPAVAAPKRAWDEDFVLEDTAAEKSGEAHNEPIAQSSPDVLEDLDVLDVK